MALQMVVDAQSRELAGARQQLRNIAAAPLRLNKISVPFWLANGNVTALSTLLRIIEGKMKILSSL